MEKKRTNLKGKHQPTPVSFKPPIHLFLALFGLYLFRFGYAYGYSDQDEFLPYLMHLLDPALFTTDWFVNTQLSTFSIRTYFVYLLFAPASLFSPPIAVALLYLASWFATASGLYYLALHLTQSRIGAILTVAISLIFTPFWTLGGNDLVHSMLVPSMVGWSLGIWGVAFFVRSRLALSAIFIGLATLFQALVGLQLGLLLGCILVIQVMSEPTISIKRVFIFSTLFLLFASPALLPLFYQQLTPPVEPISQTQPSLFYIMAAFRNPHHYLFHSFDLSRTLQFSILAVAGIGGAFLIWYKQKQNHSSSFFMTAAIGFIAALCVVAYLGTELSNNLTIAKLQLFKLTVLAKVLFIVGASQAVLLAFPARFISLFTKVFFDAPLRFTLIFAVFYAMLIPAQAMRFQSKVYPFSAKLDDKLVVYDWFAEHTHEDTIIATPPSWSGFRTAAQRSIVINHKAFPYNDIDIYQWFARLRDMAPIDLPSRTDRSLMSKLDSAYESIPSNQLRNCINTFGIDYLVRSTRLDSSYTLMFSTDVWYVYKSSGNIDQLEQVQP